jgi:hypothetical protein
MHDATLETAGRVFELAGSVLGLVGLVVTGIGLLRGAGHRSGGSTSCGPRFGIWVG